MKPAPIVGMEREIEDVCFPSNDSRLPRFEIIGESTSGGADQNAISQDKPRDLIVSHRPQVYQLAGC